MTTTATHDVNIVIPVKGITSGKSRLDGVLSPDERSELNRYLAEHTLEAATAAARTFHAIARVYVISPDPDVVEIAALYSAHFYRQSSVGLNKGLAEAVPLLPRCRTVFLAADLPDLTRHDIRPLLETVGIGIAPDEALVGTNAVSVPLPGTLAFQFGPQSAELHCQSAEKTGHPVQLIKRPGLAFDLDEKDDLIRLNGWQRGFNPRNLGE